MKYRIDDALGSEDPSGALWNAVIEALAVDGLSRESVMAELLEGLDDARSAGNEDAITAIGNALDCLIGWSSPEYSLERIGVSEVE